MKHLQLFNCIEKEVNNKTLTAVGPLSSLLCTSVQEKRPVLPQHEAGCPEGEAKVSSPVLVHSGWLIFACFGFSFRACQSCVCMSFVEQMTLVEKEVWFFWTLLTFEKLSSNLLTKKIFIPMLMQIVIKGLINGEKPVFRGLCYWRAVVAHGSYMKWREKETVCALPCWSSAWTQRPPQCWWQPLGSRKTWLPSSLPSCPKFPA